MNASQTDVFKIVDRRVVEYLLDNDISKEEEAELVDVMTTYKNLVIAGEIPLKSVGKTFRDIMDLHKLKQTKIREAKKVEEQKNMDTPIAARVHHLIDKIAKKYGVKEKSEELQEVDTMWVEKLPEPKERGTLGVKTGRLLTQIEKRMI